MHAPGKAVKDDAEKPLSDLIREPDSRPHVGLRIFALAAGALFMVAGVIGWLVPIVTGIPFYIVGLALLGVGSERVRRVINRSEARLPYRWRRRIRRMLRRSE